MATAKKREGRVYRRCRDRRGLISASPSLTSPQIYDLSFARSFVSMHDVSDGGDVKVAGVTSSPDADFWGVSGGFGGDLFGIFMGFL